MVPDPLTENSPAGEPRRGPTVSAVVEDADLFDLRDPAEPIPIAALDLTGSPRLDGEDEGHVRGLAESGLPLPPIVVHRATMRVLDGRHRLRAAELHGDTTIDARFYEGSEADAFVLAVRLNAGHGLPLSRADRTAAARRIMTSHPHWSDRRIAATTGLSARTVASIRRSTDAVPQSDTRVGRDGRVRPLDASDGRRRAARAAAADPGASLRAIAREAGVSVSTARDVRERLRLGRPVVPGARAEAAAPAVLGARSRVVVSDLRPEQRFPDTEPTVVMLRRDPSLRFTEVGRRFLRLLGAHPPVPRVWEEFAEGVPAHRAQSVARLARQHAEEWRRFAEALERRHAAGPNRVDSSPARPGG